MPDTTTANYGFVQPEVGGSNDTWGDKLNADLADIDSRIKDAMDEIAALSDAITPADFSPNSIIYKAGDGVMHDLPAGVMTVYGRRATGNIVAMDYATLKTDLGLQNVDNYSRAQLESYFNTVYALIGSGGGGGGPVGQPLADILTELSVEGIDANQLWVGDGVNSLTKKAISPFVQGLLNAADASAFAVATSSLAVAEASLNKPGYLKLANGFILNWGSVSLSSEQVLTTAYPKPCTTWSVCVGSGGPSTHTQEGDIRVTGCSATGFTASNTSGATATFFWIAVGK